MSRRNTPARCARSGSIRACCRTKRGTLRRPAHEPTVTAIRPLSGLPRPSLCRLLRDGGLGAGHRGAPHVARLRMVVAAYAMHGLAVVPHHEIMHGPFVDVDKFALCCMLGEVAQQ